MAAVAASDAQSLRRRGMISSIVNPPAADSRSMLSLAKSSSVRGSFLDYVSELHGHESQTGGFTDALREGTILNQDITQRLKEAQPETLQELNSKKGVFLQMFVFFLYVLIQGLHPNLCSFSKVGALPDGTVKKIAPYLNGVFMFSSNVVTLVLMLLVAVLADGFNGVRKCFNLRSILAMAPPGLLYAIGDVVQLAAYDNIDATLAAIISQFRMLYSALLFRFFVKKKLTTVQWMQLVVVFSLVMVYFRISIKVNEIQKGPSGSGDKDSALMITGVLMMVARVALTGPANVLSYMVFQGGDLPFYAQMAHSQMTAIPASLAVGMLEISMKDTWEYFPFRGMSCHASLIDPTDPCYWTWDIIALLFWFAFRQVFTCLILKVLDVIWKGISDVMGVFCTFILAITIFQQMDRDNNRLLLDIRLVIIFAICLATISYILSKAPTMPAPSRHSESMTSSQDSAYTGHASPVQEASRASIAADMHDLDLDGQSAHNDEDNLSKPLIVK